MNDNKNLYDKTINWFKNNRIIGTILLIFFLYLGIGKIIDSIEKIEKGGFELGIFSKKSEEPQNVKLFKEENRIIKERSSHKYLVVSLQKKQYMVTGSDNNGDDHYGYNYDIPDSDILKALVSVETGDTIINFKYNEIRVNYKNDGTLPNLINVRNLNGYWGLVDDKGQIKIPCIQSEIIGFYESNLAIISGKQHLYIIDRKGNQIVPKDKYYVAYPFKEGLAPVAIKGPIVEFMPEKGDETYLAPKPIWGFIDTLGNEIIPCKYDFVTHFENNVATVLLNGKCKIIDKTEKIIKNCNETNLNNLFPTPELKLN